MMPDVERLKTGRPGLSSNPAISDQKEDGKDFALWIADMIASRTLPMRLVGDVAALEGSFAGSETPRSASQELCADEC